MSLIDSIRKIAIFIHDPMVDRRLRAKLSSALENAYVSSLGEVIFSVVISNIAILLALVIKVASTSGAEMSFGLFLETVLKIVKSAEIIFYVLGFTAPTLWVLLKDWRARHHVAIFWTILFFEIAVVAVCAITYGLSLVGQLKNIRFANDVAVYAVIISLFLWYIALAFHRSALDKASSKEQGEPIRTSAENLLDEVSGSRGVTNV